MSMSPTRTPSVAAGYTINDAPAGQPPRGLRNQPANPVATAATFAPAHKRNVPSFSTTGSFPILPRPAAIDGSQAQKINMVRAYAWLGTSLGITAASACLAAAHLPPLGLVGSIVTFGATIGFMVATLQQPKGPQQAALNAAFNATLGLGTAGLVSVVGMPILATAGAYTAGLVGTMMAASLVFPAGSFNHWSGPLNSALLGLIVCGAITTLLPAAWGVTQALSGIECVAGLGVFSMYILRDTNRMAEKAKVPVDQFNAVEASLPIYLDVVNVFVRMVELIVRDQQRHPRH